MSTKACTGTSHFTLPVLLSPCRKEEYPTRRREESTPKQIEDNLKCNKAVS